MFSSTYLSDVLISAAAEIDEDEIVCVALVREFSSERYCVRAFERGNDAFTAGELKKRIERFLIGHRNVLRAA